VVCLSLCHTSEPCKNGYTARDAVWVEDSGSGGPREGHHVLDGGPDSPWKRDNFEGRPIVKYRETLWSSKTYTKAAKPIEMPLPFGLWAWMGRRNRMLDGVQRC